MGFLTHLIAFASGIVASFLILFLGITYFLAKKVSKSEIEDVPPVHVSTSTNGSHIGDRSKDSLNAKYNPSLSTIPEENIKVGWMKLQHSFKVWGTRWFVLRPGLLLYYGSNKAKRVWGIVRLEGCKAVPIASKKGGFAFKIYHPDNKFIYSTKGLQGETIKSAYMPGGGSIMKLRILSEQDRDDWMKAVEIACSGRSISSADVAVNTTVEDVSQQQLTTDPSGQSILAQAASQSMTSAAISSLTANNSTVIKTLSLPALANSTISIPPTPRMRAHGSSPLTTTLPPPPNPNSGYSMEITEDTRNYYDGELEIRNLNGKAWLRRWVVVRKGLLIIFNSETSSDCTAVIDLDGCDVRYWNERRRNSNIKKQQQLINEVNSELHRQGLVPESIGSDGDDNEQPLSPSTKNMRAVLQKTTSPPKGTPEYESRNERSMSLDASPTLVPSDDENAKEFDKSPSDLCENNESSERVRALDLYRSSSFSGPASLILDGIRYTADDDIKAKKKNKKNKKRERELKESRNVDVDGSGSFSAEVYNINNISSSGTLTTEAAAQQKEDVLERCFSDDEEDKSISLESQSKSQLKKKNKPIKSSSDFVSTETRDQERTRKEVERREKEFQRLLEKERKKKEKEEKKGEKKQKKSEKKEVKTCSKETEDVERQRKEQEKKEKELQRNIEREREKERKKREKEDKKEMEKQKKILKRRRGIASESSLSGIVMPSSSEDNLIPSLEIVDNMISTVVERELRDLMSDHESDNESDKDVKDSSYDSDAENERERYAFEIFHFNKKAIFVNIPSFSGKKTEHDRDPLFDLTSDFLVLRANNLDNLDWWMDVIRECSTPTSPNPASDFPILLPRYIDSIVSQSEFESCHWFTTFMTRYFNEMQQSAAFGENVKRVVTKIVDKVNLKRPKRLTPILVEKVTIGDAFPDLKQIKMFSVPTKGGNELVGEVDVLYEGGASVSISTSVIISKFVTVPLIAFIQLQLLEGKMHIFGPQNLFSRVSASFVSLPKLEFSVHLSLGSPKYQLSSLFPSIKAFLINNIKKVIWRHMVAPNRITFSLPLPEQKIRLKTEKLTSRRSRARREHERALLLSTGACLNTPYF